MFGPINRWGMHFFARFDSHLWIVRFGLALMFVESAVDKALNFTFYVHQATDMGIPFAPLAIAAALFVETAGSLALMTGVALAPCLLALAGYTLIVNFFYFDFWNMTDIAATGARKEFLKNIAVASGLVGVIFGTSRS